MERFSRSSNGRPWSVAAVIAVIAAGCASCNLVGPESQDSIVWRIDGVGGGTPAFDNETVFFVGSTHEIIAVEKATGDLRWKRATGDMGPLTGGISAVIAGDVVAMGDMDVHGFDRFSGVKRWTFHPDDGYYPGLFNLETDGTLIFAGSPSGRVYAIEGATGESRWTKVVADDNQTSVFDPKVDDGVLYVCVRHFTKPHTGGMIALDAATGVELWAREFPPEPLSGESGCRGKAAVSGDVVIGVSTYGFAYGMEKSSGAIRWTIPRLSGLPSTWDLDSRPSIVHDGTLVLGSSSGYVAAYDAATGLERWRARADRGSVYYPLATDGRDVFVVHLGGQMAAFGLSDGAVRWIRGDNTDASGEFFYSPAVDDRAIYVGGFHGLYALRKD